MAEYVRGKPLPNLKAWRMAKFMGQGELAQRAGLAKSTLARAERGDEVVSFGNIKRIAEALGISPDELVSKVPGDGS